MKRRNKMFVGIVALTLIGLIGVILTFGIEDDPVDNPASIDNSAATENPETDAEAIKNRSDYEKAHFGVAPLTPQVPIMVWEDRKHTHSNCSSSGMVTKSDRNGDGFRSVRSGPGNDYPELARVNYGQFLIICNGNEQGDWLGIVIFSHHKGECGTSTRKDKPVKYHGPCQSGWINKGSVGNLAG